MLVCKTIHMGCISSIIPLCLLHNVTNSRVSTVQVRAQCVLYFLHCAICLTIQLCRFSKKGWETGKGYYFSLKIVFYFTLFSSYDCSGNFCWNSSILKKMPSWIVVTKYHLFIKAGNGNKLLYMTDCYCHTVMSWGLWKPMSPQTGRM